MQKNAVTILPRCGDIETKKTPPALSGDFREAIETDASVSMNLLNQSAECMLNIVQRSTIPEDRVAAANALASTMQTQVNMVRALTEVLKLNKRAPSYE